MLMKTNSKHQHYYCHVTACQTDNIILQGDMHKQDKIYPESCNNIAVFRVTLYVI